MKKKVIALVTIISILSIVAVAYAARPTLYQCDKCGMQVTTTANGGPSSLGCGGKFSERHVWKILKVY